MKQQCNPGLKLWRSFVLTVVQKWTQSYTFEGSENIEDFKSSKSLIKSKAGRSENEIWVSMGKRQIRLGVFLRSQKSLNKNTRYVYEEWKGGNNQGRVVSLVEDAPTWVISHHYLTFCSVKRRWGYLLCGSHEYFPEVNS